MEQDDDVMHHTDTRQHNADDAPAKGVAFVPTIPSDGRFERALITAFLSATARVAQCINF